LSNETSWLPVAEAARVLGLTEQALRKRVARGTIDARKNNRGTLVVLVSNAGEFQAQPGLPSLDKSGATTSTTGQGGVHNAASPAVADAADMMPVSAHQKVVETLQEALTAARADLEAERRRHEAEIERMVGQFHAERSFWCERADTAECRAEQTTAALNDLVTRILTLVPAPQSVAPWWERWFGVSRRSDIR
jgi:hypothetical protein